jgi:uncharacterized protein DUF6152
MKHMLSFAMAAVFAFLAASGLLFAHHSNAVFDHEHLTILTGTVIRHEFINPHDQIHLSVTDGKGKITEWIVTGGPPAEMRRIGWSANMFKVGEELTVYGQAYRDGRPIMIRMRIVRSNGEEVSTKGTAGFGFYQEFMEKYGKDDSRIHVVGKKASSGGTSK